jgi:hypothetical protein
VRILPGNASLTAVTGLEIYVKDMLTFENDAITSIPRTLKDTRYAFVANTILPGFDDSASHMVLVDADEGAKAQATFPSSAPADTQRIAFGFEGYGYGAGAIWDILGTNAEGQEVPAYRLHFAADWANNRMIVRVWDGTSWTQVGALGPTIANKVWMNIAIDSTKTETTFSLNGTRLGSTAVRLAEVEKFTGFKAETGLVPADVGNMEHAYDDVSITPLLS